MLPYRPHYNARPARAPFPGTPKPRIEKPVNQKSIIPTLGEIMDRITIDCLEGLNENQKKAIGFPTCIWKRLRNGKYQFVKRYTTYDLAVAALPRVPGLAGEVVIITGTTAPDDEYVEALKYDTNITRFL